MEHNITPSLHTLLNDVKLTMLEVLPFLRALGYKTPHSVMSTSSALQTHSSKTTQLNRP
jgi:hypothetical protein